MSVWSFADFLLIFHMSLSQWAWRLGVNEDGVVKTQMFNVILLALWRIYHDAMTMLTV